MKKEEIKAKLDALNSDIDAAEEYVTNLVSQRNRLKYNLDKIKADEVELGVWYDITDNTEDEYTPSIYYFLPLKKYYDRLHGTLIRIDGHDNIHITLHYVFYDVDDLTKVVPTEDVDNWIKVFNNQIYQQFNNEETDKINRNNG